MLETHERKSYGITMGLMHTKCTFVCSALTALRFVRKQINMVKCNGKKPPPPERKMEVKKRCTLSFILFSLFYKLPLKKGN